MINNYYSKIVQNLHTQTNKFIPEKKNREFGTESVDQYSRGYNFKIQESPGCKFYWRYHVRMK